MSVIKRLSRTLVQHGRMFSTVSSGIPTPKSMPSTPETRMKQLTLDNGQTETTVEVIRPYLCFGFKFEQQIAYLSDVSHIPEHVWPILLSDPLAVCVMDCLHFTSHPSHFALDDAITATRRIGATKTYLIGFSHRIGHDEYVTITEAVGGKPVNDAVLTEHEKTGLTMIGEGKPVWVRPAHDGLRVFVTRDGNVSDETYL